MTSLPRRVLAVEVEEEAAALVALAVADGVVEVERAVAAATVVEADP